MFAGGPDMPAKADGPPPQVPRVDHPGGDGRPPAPNTPGRRMDRPHGPRLANVFFKKKCGAVGPRGEKERNEREK
jgi:hypothetical protein